MHINENIFSSSFVQDCWYHSFSKSQQIPLLDYNLYLFPRVTCSSLGRTRGKFLALKSTFRGGAACKPLRSGFTKIWVKMSSWNRVLTLRAVVSKQALMSVAVDGHAGLARHSLSKSARCFLLLPKLVLVSYCFVVWVLYRVFLNSYIRYWTPSWFFKYMHFTLYGSPLFTLITC